MFNIINIEQINEDAGRKTGNKAISLISNYIKENISEEYLFVRYMVPKFVIVFSGIDIESVSEFIQEMKINLEALEIEIQDKNEGDNNKLFVTPKLNFVVTTYYKGTALEGLNKKLAEYLDYADEEESNINLI